MKKWFIFGGLGIVVVIAIVIAVGISNLGPIIKTAVNTYGPKITKTELSLGDVGLSLFSGEAKLTDFLLGNPKGFNSPKAMSVGSIYVNVDEKSITQDTIVIEKIRVVKPEITYEKKKGTDNFKTILKNVQGSERSTKSSDKSASDSGGGKKIIIKDFALTGGKVNLTMAMLGQRTISTDLPEIRLKNIGEKQGGASAAKVFAEILAQLYGKITSPDVTAALNKSLKSLEGVSTEAVGKVTEQLGVSSKEAQKGLESVKGKVKGLLGN